MSEESTDAITNALAKALPDLAVWWTTKYSYHPNTCTVTDGRYFVKRGITSLMWHDLTHSDDALNAWIAGIKDEWRILQDELAKGAKQ